MLAVAHDAHCHATAGGKHPEAHLEGGDEVGGLQQSQLADLVDNGGDLRVGGSCGGLGELPSPGLLQAGDGDASGGGAGGAGADAQRGLARERHGGGCVEWLGGDSRTRTVWSTFPPTFKISRSPLPNAV